MPSFPTRLGFAASAAAAAGALALWQPAASASQPIPPAAEGAMQALADVVLIESECRQINVDYGRLFAFAQRSGIRPIEIMPLGERRAEFDAAYRRRAREASGELVCGALARDREAAIPGVLVRAPLTDGLSGYGSGPAPAGKGSL